MAIRQGTAGSGDARPPGTPRPHAAQQCLELTGLDDTIRGNASLARSASDFASSLVRPAAQAGRWAAL
jgi:hypothetical protein